MHFLGTGSLHKNIATRIGKRQRRIVFSAYLLSILTLGVFPDVTEAQRRIGRLERPCRVNADCDDGLYCNGQEVCFRGVCAATSVPRCNDGNPCTDDICDPDLDACQSVPNNNTCDDGNPCTTDGVCENGECLPGESRECDNGLVCRPSDGACVACVSADDCGSSFCTPAVCAVNNCVYLSPPCDSSQYCLDEEGVCADCVSDADCDDGVFCNGQESCLDGMCFEGTEPCGPSETCEEATENCAGNGQNFVVFDLPTGAIQPGNPVNLEVEGTNIKDVYWSVTGQSSCSPCVGEQVTYTFTSPGTKSVTTSVVFEDNSYEVLTASLAVTPGLSLLASVGPSEPVYDVDGVVLSQAGDDGTVESIWSFSTSSARIVGANAESPHDITFDFSADTNTMLGLSVEAGIAAIASSNAGVMLYSVQNDAAEPELVEVLTDCQDEGYIPQFVTLLDRTLYFGCGNRILSFDVSSISAGNGTSSFIDAYDLGDSLVSTAVFDVADRFLIVQTLGTLRTVRVFELAEDGHLAEHATIEFNPQVVDADYDPQTRILGIVSTPGLELFALADGTGEKLSEIAEWNNISGLALRGNRLYVSSNVVLREFDISDPTEPNSLESLILQNSLRKLVLSPANHSVIYASYEGGISEVIYTEDLAQQP